MMLGDMIGVSRTRTRTIDNKKMMSKCVDIGLLLFKLIYDKLLKFSRSCRNSIALFVK
jgi:hypothetical protein